MVVFREIEEPDKVVHNGEDCVIGEEMGENATGITHD
jgi:hypothetical protein